ncbi:MAG: YigZ family protein [Bacillales bacterium]|nr:YigZ family protein [Bacillales bacterium]
MSLRIKEKYVKLTEINKSKFYSIIAPIESVEETKSILVEIKKEYPKATHYCYAYIVDGKEKSNDDGEPSGTAGRPILEFLKNKELENILCIVVRYFGGIKLGASGLIRAYVDSSKNVFDIAKIYRIEEQELFDIVTSYSLFQIVKNYLDKANGNIVNVSYEEEVIITYSCIYLNFNDLKNITNGNVKIISKAFQKVYSIVES